MASLFQQQQRRRRQRQNQQASGRTGGSQGGSVLPPFLSYPPEIGAEIRGLGRGLKDILSDTGRARRINREDYGQRLADIATDRTRNLQNIGFKREDILTRQARGEEDFSTQLTGLIRNFQTKGSEQLQAQNAAGVLGGSASAAAAARREENLKIARRPIDVGRQRLAEDTARGLGRLSSVESQLDEDIARETGLAGLDFGRTKEELGTKRRRARREQLIGKQDLIESAIFQARERRPGVFTQTGKKKKKGR
jgi:hypothetical protein